jgi:sigma-B regulation protein RsbU (phosphoserine phosphatase)
VAGDFYDFYHLGDGRLAAVIADVSGKGIPAALFMALSVTVLRFGMSLDLPPDEVTRRANELIIADQRSRMFATTFVAYISLDTGYTQFSSGGHNPALLYRAASQQCEYLGTSGVAIGIFKTAEFDLETVQLNVGDILVLYTDGITEAINQDEDEFGEERLEQLVAENANLPAQHLADRILEAVNEFADEQNLFDDATLLVLKRVYATS